MTIIITGHRRIKYRACPPHQLAAWSVYTVTILRVVGITPILVYLFSTGQPVYGVGLTLSVWSRSSPHQYGGVISTVTGRVGSVTKSGVKFLDASTKYFGRVGEIFWTRRRNILDASAKSQPSTRVFMYMLASRESSRSFCCCRGVNVLRRCYDVSPRF